MDQGKFGTCVAHAFAQALCEGLKQKYGIACNPDDILSKVTALCPCFYGSDTAKIVEEWNARYGEDGASIVDTSRTWRYNVKVEARMIENLDAACFEMKMAEYMKMRMTCTIRTDEEGHNLHSVALVACMPDGKKMQALNSWGPKELHVLVDAKNFCFAMTFDPTITRAHQGDTTMPRTRMDWPYKTRKEALPSEAAKWLVDMNDGVAATALCTSALYKRGAEAGKILDELVKKDTRKAIAVMDAIKTRKEGAVLVEKMEDCTAARLFHEMGASKAAATMSHMDKKKAGAVLKEIHKATEGAVVKEMNKATEVLENSEMCPNAAAEVLFELDTSEAARFLDQIPASRSALLVRNMGIKRAEEVMAKMTQATRVREEMGASAHDNEFPASCHLNGQDSSAITYLDIDLVGEAGDAQALALKLLREKLQDTEYQHFVVVRYRSTGVDKYLYAATRVFAQKLQRIVLDVQDVKSKGQSWKGESLGKLVASAKKKGEELSGKTYPQVQAEMALISDTMNLSEKVLTRVVNEAKAALQQSPSGGEAGSESSAKRPNLRPLPAWLQTQPAGATAAAKETEVVGTKRKAED